MVGKKLPTSTLASESIGLLLDPLTLALPTATNPARADIQVIAAHGVTIFADSLGRQVLAHPPVVLGSCNFFQMLCVAAQADAASVINLTVGSNRSTKFMLQHQSVRRVLLSAKLDLPVSGAILLPVPQPAPISRDVYPRQDPVDYGRVFEGCRAFRLPTKADISCMVCPVIEGAEQFPVPVQEPALTRMLSRPASRTFDHDQRYFASRAHVGFHQVVFQSSKTA